MFIQLPVPDGLPAWLNTDFIVGIYPAEHDAAKTVLVLHDGKSITVDRDCQKIVRQTTASDRTQFLFPSPPARGRPHERPRALSKSR
jgi:hypothetical protein